MVPVASAITSLFLDEVAQAVEDKHYTHLPQVRSVPFGEALRDTVNFLGVLVGANFLALFLYVLFPFAAPLIFWALNGFYWAANISPWPRCAVLGALRPRSCANNTEALFGWQEF